MTTLGSTSPPQFPIGQSDYALLRRKGMTYVDKTLWVADVLGSASLIHVVPRPRRFGKTLNMSTLRYFVERTTEDRADLFADTAVWTAETGRYRQHFQRYPTIYLSFKDLKAESWERLWPALHQTLAEEFDRCMAVLTELGFTPTKPADLGWLQQYRTAPDPDTCTAMLSKLTDWLHQATGERSIILIDEYDAPLHSAWQRGYWDTAVPFFRNFLSTGLKDNNHLYKGVLTGILKVAKEGIFSGLNHTDTSSILTSKMSSRFGFTEDEVADLAAITGCSDQMSVIQQWYNGYQFGQVPPHTMYNPWSILSFLSKHPDAPQAFWKNTSDNALIRALMVRNTSIIGNAMERLLHGEVLERRIDENVALQELDARTDNLWALLLFSGYLSPVNLEGSDGSGLVRFKIPNQEVRSIFAETFLYWLSTGADPDGEDNLDTLSAALLTGDQSTAQELLQRRLLASLSYHDIGARPVEAVYHAFVLGMLVHLEGTHRVQSNRESGFGRADILIIPKKRGPGAVLELKRIIGDETPDSAIEKAVAQLNDRDYAAEVRSAGATEVHQFAVVFDGKRCWVRVV
jgi:hypothetical protein